MTTEPLNLFKDLVAEGNPEHKQDLKEQDEKWDKQITMYLMRNPHTFTQGTATTVPFNFCTSI